MRIFFALVAFTKVIFGASADAATVTPEKGQVLLNPGTGYKLVTQPTEAAPGHLVIANPGASARVTFPDGCSVSVQPGSVFTVTAQSPCHRAGSHVETGGSLKDPPMPQEAREERPLAPLIIGGAAIAVGAVLLLRDKDKSASP